MSNSKFRILVFILIGIPFILLVSPTIASQSVSTSNSATIGSTEVAPTTIVVTPKPGHKPIPTPTATKPIIVIPPRPIHVTVFGYTSPLATVSMSSTIDLASISADSTGYFKFSSILIPATTSELCFYALDRLGLVSQPTCIPFFVSYAQFDIGPILLSPTISLNMSQIEVGKKVRISGTTIPSSKVALYFSQDSIFEYKKNRFLVKPILLKTMSDELGNYSLSFTSGKPTDGRIFATSYKSDKKSAKSTSLSISFLPYWLIVLNYIFRALRSLSSDILLLLFICEACGVLLLLYYLLWQKTPPKALAVIEDSIIVMKSDLVRRLSDLSKPDRQLLQK